MTETQKRIKAYQKLLPELRERVIAVALLLAMSTSMLSSASFAWLTISRRPEVTNISTNIAANGNLEVALATGDGSEAPGESKEGDSAAAKGQSVAAANITWGNLINLADPSYGLKNLTLRPAELNKGDLNNAPLNAAVYKTDGRVSGLSNNFAYTSWIEPEVEGAEGYFGEATGLGVRGISSVKRQVTAFTETAESYRLIAGTANSEAANLYAGITTAENGRWMEVLAKMMGVHMSASLNTATQYTDAEVSRADLNDLINMYGAFIDAYEKEAEALAGMINWQLYLVHGGNTNAYTPWTADMIYTASTVTEADLKAGGQYAGLEGVAAGDLVVESITGTDGKVRTVMVGKIATFQTDHNMLTSSKSKMEHIRDNTQRRWTSDGLKTIINQLVNIDQCYVQKGSESPVLVADLMETFSSTSGKLQALGWMNKQIKAIVTNGVLYNFDQLTGAGIVVEKADGSGGLQITATAPVGGSAIDANLYATIVTSATTPCDFTLATNTERKKELDTGASTDSDAGEMTAQDTYGLAIDLWVRTNAENTYLTLEGNVLTRAENVPKMVSNRIGGTSPLYTLKRMEKEYQKDENGETVLDQNNNPIVEKEVEATYELYKIETAADGNTVTSWYLNGNHMEFALEAGEEPTPVMEEIQTIIGYQGVNRVWDESVVQSVDATTQGSGSCYIYYAQTPEDQARSMELLKAMRVVFIDGDGNLLAESAMDTKNSFEDGGRTIVPLVLSGKSTNVTVGEGEDAKVVRTITRLQQNVPTRVTAIVYLDGAMLTNDKVLAAGDIQGQLNIQFGSSQTLTPVRYLSLEMAERTVTAAVSVDKFDYDTHVGPMTTTVEVKVNGDTPNNMRGFFLRKINDSQGTPEDPITFTLGTDNVWRGEYTFASPGTYIMRSVQIDGQEQVLKEPLPTVEITGFGIHGLTWTANPGANSASVMTADSTYSTDLTLRFGGQKQPDRVDARFAREDGNVVSVNFTYDGSGQWEGRATFRSSGVYTLDKLVVDGDYVEVPVSLQKTINIKLGMYVTIESIHGINQPFLYLPDQMTPQQKNIELEVGIRDNTGVILPGLQNVKLIYRNQAAATRVMDTDLTWNASYETYEGALKTLESGGPGTWIFSRVEAGEGDTKSIITRASNPPAFTMISPNEPSFVEVPEKELKETLKIASKGGVIMQAKLKDSETATVVAVINGKEVQGSLVSTDEDTGINSWEFLIPTEKDSQGRDSQNGTWSMTELRVWNYYKKDGSYVEAELQEDGITLKPDGYRDTPMVFSISGYSKTVVHTVIVALTAENVTSVNGVNTRSFSGSFMEEHTFDGMQVKISDVPQGVAVTNVKLSYDYMGDAAAKGYYVAATGTTTTATNNGGSFTLEFADNGNGTYTAGAKTLRIAGTYQPYKLSFSVGGEPYSFEADKPEVKNKAPVVVITSPKPTVAITDINMDGSGVYSVDLADTVNDTWTSKAQSSGCFTDYVYTMHTPETHVHSDAYQSSLSSDGLSATLYFKCSHTDEESYSGGTRNGVSSGPENNKYQPHKYGTGTNLPRATLTLTGKGYATDAYLAFSREGGGNVILRTDTGTTDRFQWTADGNCDRYVGQVTAGSGSGSAGSDTKTCTGIIKASTLSLVYGGETYNITIPTITINNPY